MTEASSLGGKVALVTGGGTCIRRASDQAFAREGAQVAAVGLTSDLVEETIRAIETNGGDALAIAEGVTRAGDVEAAARPAVERFGDRPSCRLPRSRTRSSTA